jgi:hypothetical protein
MLSLGALLALAPITAAGPGPRTPPPHGTPGVAARSGTPGTITVTHYAPDGTTVLSRRTVRASASDSSASVAAAAGAAAPDAVRTGRITQWDDAGRPGAPIAQPESQPDARSVAAVKRVARGADCCSSSGCDAVEVTRDITSDVFGSWLGTFHHRVYWCWSYPRITGVNVACWSNVDGSFISDNGCSGWGNYYSWRGSSQGGHVSYRAGDWDNCVFRWGCFGNIYPWIEIWVNGNGAWAQDQGG